uniref:Uncharacterized protein n=1 Tax=Rhizophora mucronata TaxID=61149 RepID=A0A2P2K836_RHIMU
MERRNTNEVMIGGGGGRQSDLRKSFRLAVRPLLTCCSYEDFTKGFSRFNSSEQQSLRHLFIQVFAIFLFLYIMYHKSHKHIFI